MNQKKFLKAKGKILINKEGQEQWHELDGYSYKGLIFIHRPFVHKTSINSWNMSHLPTGRWMAAFDTLKEAKEATLWFKGKVEDLGLSLSGSLAEMQSIPGELVRGLRNKNLRYHS